MLTFWRRRRELGAEALEVCGELAQLHLPRLLVRHVLRRRLRRGRAHAGVRNGLGLRGLLQERGLGRLLLDGAAGQPRVPAGEVEPSLAAPSAPLTAVRLVRIAAGQSARIAAGRPQVAEAQAERAHLMEAQQHRAAHLVLAQVRRSKERPVGRCGQVVRQNVQVAALVDARAELAMRVEEEALKASGEGALADGGRRHALAALRVAWLGLGIGLG